MIQIDSSSITWLKKIRHPDFFGSALLSEEKLFKKMNATNIDDEVNFRQLLIKFTHVKPKSLSLEISPSEKKAPTLTLHLLKFRAIKHLSCHISMDLNSQMLHNGQILLILYLFT